jgi:hypothetical protein
MAKKRVQVGQFQKRAQLQAPARLVDQYVAPVTRQSQVAQALTSVIPALQKYQEKELETRIEKMEGEILEKINKGEYKDVLKDYSTYSEENNLVYNTHAKKRYEQILAPQAAMQVGLKLREAYNKSEYRNSTNPTDFNKFLEENISNFTKEYEGLFTATGGGVKSFSQALSPEINKMEQYFVENASANNYREELESYNVQLNNVTSAEQLTDFFNDTNGTFLSNKDRDEAILSWASQGVDIPIDGEFTSRNFDLIKDKQVGNTGQTYGERYKELAEKSNPAMLEVSQLNYNEKVRSIDETNRKNFLEDKEEEISPKLTAAFEAKDFDEVDRLIDENFSGHPLMSEHHMQQLKDRIYNNYDAARIKRETSLQAIQAYELDIIDNIPLDSEDVENTIRTYVLSREGSLTPSGYGKLNEAAAKFLSFPFNEEALQLIQDAFSKAVVGGGQSPLSLPLGEKGIVHKGMAAIKQQLLASKDKERYRNMTVSEAYEEYRMILASRQFRDGKGDPLNTNNIPAYSEIGKGVSAVGQDNELVLESDGEVTLKMINNNVNAIGQKAAATNQGTDNE